VPLIFRKLEVAKNAFSLNKNIDFKRLLAYLNDFGT